MPNVEASEGSRRYRHDDGLISVERDAQPCMLARLSL